MAKYRKKPVVIEAVRWNGVNTEEVLDFGGGEISEGVDCLEVFILEGRVTVLPGEYVIRGVKGEYYPCKPDVFDLIYELVTDHPETVDEEM